MQLKKILACLVIIFVFIAGTLSKYSELIFIAHSYMFALGIITIFVIFIVNILLNEGELHKFTFNPLIALFILAFLILISFSISKYDSIMETYRIVTPILLFIVMINTIHCKSDRNLYTYALVAFGIFIGILSYIRFYELGFGSVALDSIWGYTNTFAAFLVLQIFVSSAIYLETENKNTRMLISVIPMFFIFLLFLTVSRGGYIALVVGSIAFLILSKGQSRKLFKGMFPVLIGAFALIAVGSPKEIVLANIGKTNTLAQFAVGASNDVYLWDRLHMAVLAVKIFLQKPLTGFGLGTFRYTFAINEWVGEPFRIDPHSLFFKLLAESGIIGTVAFFLLTGFILTKGFVKSLGEKEDFIYKGIVAGTIGMLFHMCIDVDIYPIMFIILFFVLALLVQPEFVRLKLNQKFIFATFGIILVLVVHFDLFPKTTASRYAVRAESPSSLVAVSNAINSMKQAIELDAKSASYYFYLGDLLSKSSTKDSSNASITTQMIASYEEAYTLNKHDYRAPFRLGMYYLPQRTMTSINYLLESESLYPTNPNIESWLAVAYCYVEKDSAKASEHLSKAKEYNRGSLDLSFAEGVYELSRGNKVLADKYFSTLSFYNDIYQKFGPPNNYSAGTYNVETTIIRDLEKELGN